MIRIAGTRGSSRKRDQRDTQCVSDYFSEWKSKEENNHGGHGGRGCASGEICQWFVMNT